MTCVMGSKLRVFNAPTTTTRAAIRLIVSSTALVGGGSCGRPADVPLPTDSTNSTHRSSVQLSPSVTIVSPTPPAGRPDGWHVAESDLGRFSVELPLPSQSYRIENGPAGLPTRFEDTVVAYSNNKDLVYTFSCVAQGDGSALDKGETATLAKDFQRAFVPSGSVKSLPCRSPWTQCFEVIGEDRHLRTCAPGEPRPAAVQEVSRRLKVGSSRRSPPAFARSSHFNLRERAQRLAQEAELRRSHRDR